jgi:hypothetical protein
MSDILNSDCRIDRDFFRPRGKASRKITHHLEWVDDSRLSLKRVEGVRKRKAPFDFDKKAVCDEIVRIAEMEVGRI